MVSTLDSGSSNEGSNPGWDHYDAYFLAKTLHSHSTLVSSARWINRYQQILMLDQIRGGEWSFKNCVSQNFSQISGVSSSRIFLLRLLAVSISFARLKRSRARKKDISLAVSQSLTFTIRHPSYSCNGLESNPKGIEKYS